MFVAALSQIACNNQSSQDKASACLSDPVCRQQVAAASAPQLFPLGATAGVPGALPPAVAGQVPGIPAQPFNYATVANAAIKAQSAKVAQKINEDDNNPLSTYYKSPTPNAVKSVSQVSAESTQASASPASREPAAADVSSSGGFGEASR